MVNYGQYRDTDLLSLLAYDDEQAFVAIYQRYWQTLYDAAFRRLRDSGLAEDIVQDVFITLWSRREELSVEKLEPYLLAAVRYRILNHVARNTAPDPLYQPLEDILAAGTSADGKILEKELQQLALSFIAALPGKRRRIFELRFIEGLNTLEIATRLGISRKTVQNQLRTAVEDFKTQLTTFLVLLCTI